jgi:hypothetical protein
MAKVRLEASAPGTMFLSATSPPARFTAIVVTQPAAFSMEDSLAFDLSKI